MTALPAPSLVTSVVTAPLGVGGGGLCGRRVSPVSLGRGYSSSDGFPPAGTAQAGEEATPRAAGWDSPPMVDPQAVREHCGCTSTRKRPGHRHLRAHIART